MTKSRGILAKRIRWTAEQEAELRARYPNERTADIASAVGHPVKTIYQKAVALGLKKTAEFLASPAAGRTTGRQGIGTRFETGSTPWNKGTNFSAGGRSPETRFKKGSRPHTWRPIGTERVSKDGYLQRKMTDTGISRHDYVFLHVMLWEEHNGPVPNGYCVAFKDKNKNNIAINNLEMISRADLMKRNTRHNLPKEIADLIQLRGALNRKINARIKNEQHD